MLICFSAGLCILHAEQYLSRKELSNHYNPVTDPKVRAPGIAALKKLFACEHAETIFERDAKLLVCFRLLK